MQHCLLCSNSASIDNSSIHESKIDCSICGKYSITATAINTIPKDRYSNWSQMLQNYIKANQISGRVIITTDTIHSLFGY